MLSLYTGSQGRRCDGVSRRDFIRAGALGFGGLTLPGLLRARTAAATAGKDFVKDKSVVLLFLAGGASQYETIDPKMDMPAEIRSVTGEITTSVPGITFGSTFPHLAKIAHKLAIVRSFWGPGGYHEAASVDLLTGGTARPHEMTFGDVGASMGSYYSNVAGANHPRTGTPSYSLLIERELDEFYINYFLKATRLGSAPGGLGAAYAAFEPNRASTARENMDLRIPPARFSDRRLLLSSLDKINRRIDQSGTMEGLDQFHQQAFDVMRGGAMKALDLSDEDPRTIELYDTSLMKIYGHKNPKQHGPSTIGKLLLMARRLCEAGSGFVTVGSSGWDMHGDINNLPMVRGMEMISPPVDKAIAAFIQDVEQRGLTDKILLVIAGEFGRSPRLNQFAGRDHWIGSSPLILYGGGLKMGQVIGQSTADGSQPATEPLKPSHLMATILNTLFDVGQLRLETALPHELRTAIDTFEPIPHLL